MHHTTNISSLSYKEFYRLFNGALLASGNALIEKLCGGKLQTTIVVDFFNFSRRISLRAYGRRAQTRSGRDEWGRICRPHPRPHCQTRH